MQKDDPVLDSGLVTPVGGGSTMGTGMAVMRVARSVDLSRLLLRLAVTGGLVVAAWVIGVVLAGSASADIGLGLSSEPGDDQAVVSGYVVNTKTRPAAAVSAIGITSTTRPQTTVYAGAVSNEVAAPPVVVTPPIPPPPPIAVAPVAQEPQAAPVRKSVERAKPRRQAVKAVRAVTAIAQTIDVASPPQAAPPAKSENPDDGPLAQSGKTPQVPAPTAPACPAAPGSAAAPSYDNGGHARASLGVLTDRARLAPLAVAGATASGPVEPSGDAAGLLSSAPD
ncbi:hypothetical protein [Actinokineospora inagensis]|uniref:hypothetical protein n=1 Tax=Actinokineospora inagensis TaxID=103730 RepID=UPI000415688B|nr:hypothetical protein [Actinokineospora inagensis]